MRKTEGEKMRKRKASNDVGELQNICPDVCAVKSAAVQW